MSYYIIRFYGGLLMNNNLINNLFDIISNSKDDDINSLYNDMSKYQKKIFDNLKTDKDFLDNYSLNDIIFDFDKDFVEKILDLELNLYLEECKNNGCYNKKNGTTKNIDLTIGNTKIKFNRPRLRNESDFDSVIIPKRTRIIKDISDNIILLYSKNNSVNDIKEILSSMFDINVSTAFISNLTQQLYDEVFAWRNKQLDPCYFAINIDCTYISIRDKKYLNSHKIPIYIVVGTTLSGNKEIIGMYLGNEDESKNVIDNLYCDDIAESKAFWLTVFNDLKDRGVEKVLYASSDGLTGIEDAITSEFDGVFYQRCIVHLTRNLKSYTSKKNCKEVMADFKNIYTAPSKDIALENVKYFLEKYSSEKTLLKHAREYIDYILPLFDLPVNIRKYIYTYNIVESANSKIKRGFYGRGALPNINSALNIIYVNLKDLEKKWQSKKVSNWANIYNEILMLHYDDIKEYII